MTTIDRTYEYDGYDPEAYDDFANVDDYYADDLTPEEADRLASEADKVCKL